MNPDEESGSIQAMINCMQTLGLSRRIRSHRVPAKMRTERYDRPHGEIDVCFDLCDPSNGFEINCETDHMKGFGINHGNFQPWQQKFSFDEEAKALTITSDHEKSRYRFVFCFDR